MTKRIVALLIAVIFVVSCSMLTACTETKTTDKKDPTTNPAESTQPSDPADVSTPADGGNDDVSTPADGGNDDVSTPADGGDDTEWTLSPEPDKAADESAWVKWLLDIYDNDYEYSTTLNGLGYPYLESGKKYDVKHPDAADGTQTPWEKWGTPASFHMCYQFDKAEYDFTPNVENEDYAFQWDIYYRPLTDDDEPIGDGNFKKITTKPYSVYTWPEGSMVIYRIRTFAQGMNDLAMKEDGTPQHYELIFVISDTDNDNKIIGWHQLFTKIDESYVKYLADAQAEGAEGI